jgi:hypothetical protein
VRLSNRFRMLALVASLVSVLALTAGLAAPAFADLVVSYPGPNGPRGTTQFFAYGDKFRVCDEYGDGYGVGVRWSYIKVNGDSIRGSHWNSGGVGCRTWDHNFGEGRTVWMQTCIKNDATVVGCTAVFNTRA